MAGINFFKGSFCERAALFYHPDRNFCRNRGTDSLVQGFSGNHQPSESL